VVEEGVYIVVAEDIETLKILKVADYKYSLESFFTRKDAG
jgi:hypothetical protein